MNDPTRAADTGNRSELNPANDAPHSDGDKPVQSRRPASSSRTVARSAGIVSLAVMSSRVLGLVREMVFAYFFGASKGLANDAYVIAFRIPNLLRDLFAEGALSSAFVTVFSDYLVTKDEKEAFRLSNLVTNALIVILGVLVVLGIIFAEPVVRLIAPGFEGNQEKFRLTVQLTRIMMPFILLVALAAQAMGILNARDRFGVPAMASTFFNVGSIVGGIVTAVLLTDPGFSAPLRSIVENPTTGIIGMAYGVLIGGLAQYAIQWPSLRRVGFRYRPGLSFSDPGLRRVFKLMGPAVIGAAAVQVNILVNSNFASNIPGEGPVSWLNYSFRLMQFPIGVFGVAIATATLPAISRQAALQELGDFRRTLAASLRLAFVLTIPSAVGLIVLGRPIIELIYERGRFGAEDSARTANALACYAIGLAGYAAVRILAPAFYALGDAKTPMRISLFSMVLNFVLNWLLVQQFHERGLALSTSAVAILNFAVLYFAMRKRIKGLEGRATLAAMAKILGASVVMGAACLGVGYAVDAALADGFATQLGKVVASVLVGAVVFYLIASWLRVAELKMAGDMLAGRFRRMFRRSQTTSQG
jgi:putative peptidoglycan lipid II flippase